MPTVSVQYNTFLEIIFGSSNLDYRAQKRIVTDLWDENFQDTVDECARHTLWKANSQNYNIVTRFVPPYCLTVTLYKNTIGFVTVSSLDPNFQYGVTNLGGGFHVTEQAVTALGRAYYDTLALDTAKHVASTTFCSGNPRDSSAHETAINEYNKACEAGTNFKHNEIYIRVEGPAAPQPPVPGPPDPKTILQYHPTPLSGIRSKIKHRTWRLSFYLINKFLHWMFASSKVDFQKGPAAVMNDFAYKTHNGKYAKKLHIIGGELSAHLNCCGKPFALLTLNATNVGVAAVIGLLTTAKIGNTETALKIAALVLLGLFVWQTFWTYFVSTTTYKNIAFNDFRLRTVEQAVTLFGLDDCYLRLLLAIISPQEDINAHGSENSYLDVAGMGVLEVTDSMLSEILYVAGYITSSLDPVEINQPPKKLHADSNQNNNPGSPAETGDQEESEGSAASNTTTYKENTPNELEIPESSVALAAWVPFDTHRIIYSSNNKVRRFSLIDSKLHLSNSRRSSIERTGESKLVFAHDRDQLNLPTKLRIYGNIANCKAA
ncbi:hypothetical protein MGU_10505 [Metarhizium guizhouense ARSEF 977]|uniref:Uncharacterized protein n=1 Tax=Metarhizium guizhouense (strain ARSEF 977) TaxID=1276136 RepID=A0A0B4HRQ9_METGA|nr:hypothetical protein MGU_10505 [Metarhizium guizhouense ARSEF 977]